MRYDMKEKSNWLTKSIVLENDRALLRPLESSDFELLLPYSLNEPELWEFSLIPANGENNLRNYIQKALAEKASGTSYPFLVIDKQTGKVAGSTRFYDFQARHNTTQLGYTWYGKAFQRTGLNRNCKLIMLEFAFESLKLDRVEFRADANNARSIAAMKNIGCMPEGILRSNCAAESGRRDSIVLSILQSEWAANVKDKIIASIRS